MIVCSKTILEASIFLSTWQEIWLVPAALFNKVQEAVIPSGNIRGIVKLRSLTISFDKEPSIKNLPLDPQVSSLMLVTENVAGILSSDWFSSNE